MLSPIAQQILTFIKTEKDPEKIWSSLDTLRPTNHIWDDLINVAVQLRINKQWDLIILVNLSRYVFIFWVPSVVCVATH